MPTSKPDQTSNARGVGVQVQLLGTVYGLLLELEGRIVPGLPPLQALLSDALTVAGRMSTRESLITRCLLLLKARRYYVSVLRLVHCFSYVVTSKSLLKYQNLLT